MKKSNQPSYIPVIILILSFGLFALSGMSENFTLQAKLGFIGKCGLVIGAIGLWLFTIMPYIENRNK